MIASATPKLARTTSRAGDVRQQVPGDDLGVANAEATGREDELALTERQELPADESRGRRPAQQPQDDHDVDRAGADHRQHGDDDDQDRERHDRVGDSHEDAVDEPSAVSGKGADRRPDRHVDRHRDEPDRQRDPSPVQQPGQDVAPRPVGAEQWSSVGGLRTSWIDGVYGSYGRQHRRKDRRHGESDQEPCADHRPAVRREPLPLHPARRDSGQSRGL